MKVKQEKTMTRESIHSQQSGKKLMTYVVLVGMIALVLDYLFLYRIYAQKTEQVMLENEQLQTELATWKDYYENIEQYQAQSLAMRTEIDTILARYPADVKEEDVLMLAVDMQEQNNVTFSNINMEQTQLVTEVSQDIVLPAQIEGLDETLSFQQKNATYVIDTDYSSLKACVEQIYRQNNRIAIYNIALIADETAAQETTPEESSKLYGTIDVSFYSVQGTDKEYEAPNMTRYERGMSDLFRVEK